MIEILVGAIVFILFILGIAKVKLRKEALNVDAIFYDALNFQKELNYLPQVEDKYFLKKTISLAENLRKGKERFSNALNALRNYREKILQQFYKKYTKPFNELYIKPLIEKEGRLGNLLGTIDDILTFLLAYSSGVISKEDFKRNVTYRVNLMRKVDEARYKALKKAT